MRKYLLRLIAALCCLSRLSIAQISPGELSRAHATLEGVSNCSQCHESGQEISGAKCLTCHVEIKKAIDTKRGYHAAVSGSSCISCHQEHLGKDAKITQFDESRFDHAKSGFSLTGKHGSVQCTQCHVEKFITSVEVRNVLKDHPHKTFLGLEQRCVSCHDDRHKRTVSQDCQTCHTPNGWKPATAFDHARARFQIAGRHKSVECAKCHGEMSNRSPAVSILFSTQKFSDCMPCHSSPHGSKFANKTCKSCHNAEGWKVVSGFNHAETRFPLTGKHQSLSCEKCHTEMGVKKGFNVDLRTKAFADCRPCHDSPHRFALGDRQCRGCHSPISWSTAAPTPFDHALTRYKLTGKHAVLQCEKCHKGTQGRQTYQGRFLLSYGRCADCHADYHRGQFTKKYASDCALCHTEKGYNPSTFTVAGHNDTRFSLKGAHAAVPCNDCHRKQGRAESVFTFASVRCESCHADKHNGQFNRFMPESGCVRCHVDSEWKKVAFDHVSTKFQMLGKHLTVACADCHKEQRVDGVKGTRYQGAPTECQSCHQDAHAGQFAQGGESLCNTCHSPLSWRTLLFNHETQSAFKLTGAHKNVPCRSCHKEEMIGDKKLVRYKPLPTTCESCHQGVVR